MPGHASQKAAPGAPSPGAASQSERAPVPPPICCPARNAARAHSHSAAAAPGPFPASRSSSAPSTPARAETQPPPAVPVRVCGRVAGGCRGWRSARASLRLLWRRECVASPSRRLRRAKGISESVARCEASLARRKRSHPWLSAQHWRLRAVDSGKLAEPPRGQK
eukprot:scaffold22049_cov73-Isochrysis_galbana.AAC.1